MPDRTSISGDGYSIELRDGLTIVTFTRTLTFEEVIAVTDEVARIDKSGQRIWDITGHFAMSADEIKRLAEYGKQLWPERSKVAFIAADDLAFGLLRMFEVYRDGPLNQSKAFRSREAALAWFDETGDDEVTS